MKVIDFWGADIKRVIQLGHATLLEKAVSTWVLLAVVVRWWC